MYLLDVINSMYVFVFVGCSYKGTCYDLGARVIEDCNTLVCSYDDVSLGYDLILQQQGMFGRSRTLLHKRLSIILSNYPIHLLQPITRL